MEAGGEATEELYLFSLHPCSETHSSRSPVARGTLPVLPPKSGPLFRHCRICVVNHPDARFGTCQSHEPILSPLAYPASRIDTLPALLSGYSVSLSGRGYAHLTRPSLQQLPLTHNRSLISRCPVSHVPVSACRAPQLSRRMRNVAFPCF